MQLSGTHSTGRAPLEPENAHSLENAAAAGLSHASGVFCKSALCTHQGPKGEAGRLGNDCLNTH